MEARLISIRSLFLVLLSIFVFGCSTTPSSKSSNATRESRVRLSSDEQPTEIIVQGIKLQNTQFDYPITINSAVEQWVDYFTGRGRPHFERYLERSELFIPYIKPILKQNGLPEDLVYLAMIESGFNNHARSHAKAVGPWQFISATGKRYGLSVNWWVDERRDTKKSTISAAQYLKDLYGMFQSWELAASAYNAGEAKIARAIRRYGTNDFWALARQKFFRPETRNYVPKLIAAALVAKNRTQFGFPATYLGVPKPGEAVAPDGEVVKLETAAAQSPSVAAREALESVLKSEDYETALTQDEELAIDAPASMAVAQVGNDSGEEIVSFAKPIVNKKGQLVGEELLEFELQSPADLLKVSRAAGLSYHTVKSLNPEILRWCTPPNVGSYRIKLPASSKDRFLTTYNSPEFSKKVQFLTYKVRGGQSLAAVARHFGIKADPIADLNGVSPKASLRQGMVIRLPMPSDGTRDVAALEIRDPPERRRRSARRVKRTSSSFQKRKAYKVTLRERAKVRQTANEE